jgi:hypothetical protein
MTPSLSDFQVKFTLKQHTPMIHFQGDEQGATLRATELKPKLDRYLMRNCFCKYEYKDLRPLLLTDLKEEEWSEAKDSPEKLEKLIEEKRLALDYKVRIQLGESSNWRSWTIDFEYSVDRENPKPVKFPCFFANMGDEAKKNYAFTLCNNVTVLFFSLNSHILDALKDFGSKFLAETNFGARASKGFGSFSLSHINNEKIQEQAIPEFNFKFTVKTNNDIYKKIWPDRKFNPKVKSPSVDQSRLCQDAYYRLFHSIDYLYRYLRSGINLPIKKHPFYCKPAIFLYAKSLGHGWDKKAFKSEFLNQDGPDSEAGKKLLKQTREHEDANGPVMYEPSCPSEKYVYREMLGLSPDQFWMGYNFHVVHNFEKEEHDIARFQSPIRFKVLPGSKGGVFDVYILLDPIHDGMINTKFKYKRTGDRGSVGKAFPLSSPPKFDLQNFLDFSLNVSCLESSVEKKFRDHEVYYVLQDILSNMESSHAD